MRRHMDIHALLEPDQGFSRLSRLRHPRATIPALLIQALGLALVAGMAWLLALHA